MKKFIPPKNHKVIYMTINATILIAFLTLLIVYGNNIVIMGLSMGTFFLFNGIWSLNKKNYSLIHRDDKSYSIQYVWIMALIVGILLLVICLVYLIF